MSDLLLEIGLEEIPARMIPSAQAELLKRTLALLEREHLLVSTEQAAAPEANAYSTPRRLAVLIRGRPTSPKKSPAPPPKSPSKTASLPPPPKPSPARTTSP